MNESGSYIYILLSTSYVITVNNITNQSPIFNSYNIDSTTSYSISCDPTGQYVAVCTSNGFFFSSNFSQNFSNILNTNCSYCTILSTENIYLSTSVNIVLINSNGTILEEFPLPQNTSVQTFGAETSAFYYNTFSSKFYVNNTLQSYNNTLYFGQGPDLYVDYTGQYVYTSAGNVLETSFDSGATFINQNTPYINTINSTNNSLGNYLLMCGSTNNEENFYVYSTINLNQFNPTFTQESQLGTFSGYPVLCATNGCNTNNYPLAIITSQNNISIEDGAFIWYGIGNTGSSVN